MFMFIYVYIYLDLLYIYKNIFFIFVYIRILGMMKVVRGFFQKLKMFCPFYFGLLLAPVDQSDIMWHFFSPTKMLDISCDFFPIRFGTFTNGSKPLL